MRKLICLFIVALALWAPNSWARGSRGGGSRSGSRGGSYRGGSGGSSHKGGHYKNPRTGDRYTKHK